ncbi:hypothetical protein CANINC_001733 [Pichia inconspicua]|uniref:2-dehydropantoate 2-reductase n=1 Tax=Pichia inconspicua TaxID=52247 RepID=A0A4T0X4D4_9ASCO|nr:hypothetical protein CANINC_001733 [[Candida] inconspicua]
MHKWSVFSALIKFLLKNFTSKYGKHSCKRVVMSIYVLGAGGVGTLVATALTNSFKVNFIVRNASKIECLKLTDNTFEIKRLYNQGEVLKYKINAAFTVDSLADEKIEFLLVCVKTFDTVASLTPLLNKINEKTRILLIQNGMGVVDELYEKVWKDEKSRPIIYQGVISHGVWQNAENNNTYNYNHAGYGDSKICRIPKVLSQSEYAVEEEHQLKSDPVILALVASDLRVSTYTYSDLLVYQIQKLLVNSCMNSTTSIINCINYKLENLPGMLKLFTSIVSEGLDILYKAYPNIQESPLAKELLTVEKHVAFVQHVGFKINGKNSTSMRQDVLNCRDTEIDYINGHIVKKAAELGLFAPVANTICNLVSIRLDVNRRTVAEEGHL